MYYTLGQRKGLGIGGIKNHATGSWFVVDKSIEKRELYVVQGEESDYLYSSKTIVKDVNWISEEYFEGYKELSVKYRYRQKDIKANVRFIDKNTIEVINIDKAIYGKIKGVTDKEYYTNSFHVPVYYNTSIKHKLET